MQTLPAQMLTLTLLPNPVKILGQSPFLALKLFRTWLRGLPSSPRDLNYVNNKTFHSFLTCVWRHQF